MKTLLLALLLSTPLLTAAQAETLVRGFNPRFSTSPANPDEPNYRPRYSPQSRLDVTIDAERWRDRRHCRDRRSCRGNGRRN